MSSLSAKKILVVEDEHDILQLVKLYLEKEGFRTVTASTGMEGLRQVKQEKPDLVVLDLMLPEMDGLEVCKRLRSAPATAMLPIIILTAKAEETVLSTFDHPSGWFVFDPEATTVASPLSLDMAIPEAIARGIRRAEDAAIAAVSLEQPGHVLRKSAKPPSSKINSAWPLRSTYGAVDGERNIDELVLHLHGARFHVIQRLYQLFSEGFIELVPRDDFAEGVAAAPAIPEVASRDDQTLAISADELLRVVPIAVPREVTRDLGDVSIVEKYLLTLCDGTRDVRTIVAVASVRPHVVTASLRALIDRGFLRATMGAVDRT